MGGTAVTVLGFCLGGNLLMRPLWFQNEKKIILCLILFLILILWTEKFENAAGYLYSFPEPHNGLLTRQLSQHDNC
jgi:hypothetical protein